MATQASILAWRIRGQRSPMDSTRWSRRVGHDWATDKFTFNTYKCYLHSFFVSGGSKATFVCGGCLTKLEEYVSAVPRSLYSLRGGTWFCSAGPSSGPPLTTPQLEEKLCFALQDKGKVQAHPLVSTDTGGLGWRLILLRRRWKFRSLHSLTPLQQRGWLSLQPDQG